jgi:hypothetical protein
MADTDVIRDVSNTLVNLIEEAVKDMHLGGTSVALNDLSGKPNDIGAHLTVFLFEILEDPPSRNRPLVRQIDPVTNRVILRKPPMALQLNYLITPWTKNFEDDQRLLGRVLQLFYDEAIVSGAQLSGNLASTVDSLKITMHQITLEDRTRIWFALQRPYRTSLSYGVRVVNLDPSATKDQTFVPVNGAQLASNLGAEGTP